MKTKVDELDIPIIQPHDSVKVVGQVFNNVLILNQDFAPLAVARIPRALSLLSRQKAECLEHGVEPITTPSCSIPRPSVIRLFSYIKRPRPKIRLTRHHVFARDNWTCQYCGKQSKELTIDHVLPLSRGGRDSWMNCITACRTCNHRKGARTPEEAHMKLLQQPFEPRVTGSIQVIKVQPRPEWMPFLAS